jgi:hypothetical protein
MSRQQATAEPVRPLWPVLLPLAVLAGCSDRISPPVAPSSAADNLPVISGYVYQEVSAAGEPPIFGALITLRNVQGAESTALSDRRGFYFIRTTPGEVVITASKEGYGTRESRFEVSGSMILNFGLTPALP